MCKRCMMKNSSQVCSYSVHGKQLLDQSPDSMQMFSAKHSQMFSPTGLSIVGPHSQSGRSIPAPAGGPQWPPRLYVLLSVLTYTHPIWCAGQPCPRWDISMANIPLTCKSRKDPRNSPPLDNVHTACATKSFYTLLLWLNLCKNSI